MDENHLIANFHNSLSHQECQCNGSGWVRSQIDTWHECPYHFEGQENMKTRTFHFNSYGAISVEPRADTVPFTLQRVLDGETIENKKASMCFSDPKIVIDSEPFWPEIWTIAQFEDFLLELVQCEECHAPCFDDEPCIRREPPVPF